MWRQKSVIEPAVSAQTPCIGVRWVMREPKVAHDSPATEQGAQRHRAWQAITHPEGNVE